MDSLSTAGRLSEPSTEKQSFAPTIGQRSVVDRWNGTRWIEVDLIWDGEKFLEVK